jgi:Cu+-exporting ATPase
MAKVKDPVCGMEIEAGAAAGQSTSGGSTYYFCSTQCQQKFNTNSSKYAAAGTVAHGGDKIEALERNLTQKGGATAPRFGSAGSGGLEFEGPPGSTKVT